MICGPWVFIVLFLSPLATVAMSRDLLTCCDYLFMQSSLPLVTHLFCLTDRSAADMMQVILSTASSGKKCGQPMWQIPPACLGIVRYAWMRFNRQHVNHITWVLLYRIIDLCSIHCQVPLCLECSRWISAPKANYIYRKCGVADLGLLAETMFSAALLAKHLWGCFVNIATLEIQNWCPALASLRAA